MKFLSNLRVIVFLICCSAITFKICDANQKAFPEKEFIQYFQEMYALEMSIPPGFSIEQLTVLKNHVIGLTKSVEGHLKKSGDDSEWRQLTGYLHDYENQLTNLEASILAKDQAEGTMENSYQRALVEAKEWRKELKNEFDAAVSNNTDLTATDHRVERLSLINRMVEMLLEFKNVQTKLAYAPQQEVWTQHNDTVLKLVNVVGLIKQSIDGDNDLKRVQKLNFALDQYDKDSLAFYNASLKISDLWKKIALMSSKVKEKGFEIASRSPQKAVASGGDIRLFLIISVLTILMGGLLAATVTYTFLKPVREAALKLENSCKSESEDKKSHEMTDMSKPDIETKNKEEIVHVQSTQPQFAVPKQIREVHGTLEELVFQINYLVLHESLQKVLSGEEGEQLKNKAKLICSLSRDVSLMINDWQNDALSGQYEFYPEWPIHIKKKLELIFTKIKTIGDLLVFIPHHHSVNEKNDLSVESNLKSAAFQNAVAELEDFIEV